jgi:hypothetical protein
MSFPLEKMSKEELLDMMDKVQEELFSKNPEGEDLPVWTGGKEAQEFRAIAKRIQGSSTAPVLGRCGTCNSVVKADRDVIKREVKE